MSDKPMPEPVLLVLISLAGGAKSTGDVRRDIARLAAARVRWSLSPLSAALRRLVDLGLAYEETPDTFNGRPRNRYALTEQGRERLHAEIDAINHYLDAGTRRLHAHPLDLLDPPANIQQARPLS